MNIAIVGSRTFPQLKLVEWFIRDLPLGVRVISGGAAGVDSAAIEYARQRGLETTVRLPDLNGCKERHEFTERYYARNQTIVNDADLIVAFTEKDKGGTWDTIKRAHKTGKPFKVIKPSLLFPGEADESNPETDADKEDGSEDTPATGRELRKGQGPFQIRRVSLGSYALRRKCYIDSEAWAEIIADKDNDPERLAEKMLPAFRKFFEDNRRLGCVHAVTVPPRSKRNLDKPHVMDIVAETLAREIGTKWARMFEPWEKSTRGRFAKHGDIKITGDLGKYIGKVVWVLDDITTTNYTLRAAVQSLISLEIHAHGLAYVVMA